MKRQRVSMRDIARAADLSVSAVSLVVRGRPGIAAETRARVLQIIEDLGYQGGGGDDLARPPAIGLLIERGSVPMAMDLFYGEVLRGVQDTAERLGYQIVFESFDRADQSMERVRERLLVGVRGLLIVNDGDITPAMVGQLEDLNIPMVLIENYLPDHRLMCVGGDNVTAGYMAVQHLVQLGHRRIAILRGPAKYSSLTDRLRGGMAAAAEAGVLIPAALLPAPKAGHPKKGYEQMREILRLPELPTAIFAVSDKTAYGAIEAIKEAGLRIPDQIAIVSIDDVAESAFTRPALTTVHIPRYEIGQLALQKLHHLMHHPADIPVKSLVYGSLIVRDSCGARSHTPASSE
ncbi:MAG: LacI family DNA-binding transcriptional regulator [Roseiflexaceae bacterium]